MKLQVAQIALARSMSAIRSEKNNDVAAIERSWQRASGHQ
jgi:hypothetical protein